jgi:hypothetical protein
MTGGTLSKTSRLLWAESEYVVFTGPAATMDVLPHGASATHSLVRATKNVMLPFLFTVASFGSPAVPLRRVFSGAAVSQSAVAYDEWLLDRFEFTQEHADLDEVRALNALLELPVRTGFELDPFD